MEVSNYIVSSFLRESPKFKTSLNVIGEVMNVPMCALSSILRANGYEEVPSASICIDEEMLTYFADAYIRKMKNYFLSSVRNIENLTYQQLADLNEFYNNFRNSDLQFSRKAKWSQIDTGLIRDAFMDRIKILTPKRKTNIDYFLERIIEKIKDEECCIVDSCNCEILEDCYRLPEYKVFESRFSTSNDFLIRITHTEYYQEEVVKSKLKKTYCCPVYILRRMLIAARYYIFAADDDEPYNNIPFVENSHFFKNLNSKNYEDRTTFSTYRRKQSSRGRQACA